MLRCTTSSHWHRKFSVSAQISEPNRKTVLKLPVDCSKWLRPNMQNLYIANDSPSFNSFMVSSDRRCCWPAAAEARTQLSARYGGARSCIHLKTIMAVLNSICWRIGSQWKSRSTVLCWQTYWFWWQQVPPNSGPPEASSADCHLRRTVDSCSSRGSYWQMCAPCLGCFWRKNNRNTVNCLWAK